MKNKTAGQSLAHERWKKATPKEKQAAVKKMNKARLAKLKKRKITNEVPIIKSKV